jgi:hypothetical protein
MTDFIVSNAPIPTIKNLLKAYALAPLASMIPVFVLIALMAAFDKLAPNMVMAGLAAYLTGLALTYGHIALFALPFTLGIRKKISLTKKRCTIAGAAVGGIPIFSMLFFWDNFYAAPTTLERNIVTTYTPVVIFAVFGALTGYAFWRILSSYSQPKKPSTEEK